MGTLLPNDLLQPLGLRRETAKPRNTIRGPGQMHRYGPVHPSRYMFQVCFPSAFSTKKSKLLSASPKAARLRKRVALRPHFRSPKGDCQAPPATSVTGQVALCACDTSIGRVGSTANDACYRRPSQPCSISAISRSLKGAGGLIQPPSGRKSTNALMGEPAPHPFTSPSNSSTSRSNWPRAVSTAWDCSMSTPALRSRSSGSFDEPPLRKPR